MALVNSQLKWQEEDRDECLSALADLHMLQLAVEWIRSACLIFLWLLVFVTTCSTWLCTRFGSGCLSILGGFPARASPLIQHLNVEEHVTREAILHAQVDLLRFIQLGMLGHDFDRVSLIHVRDQFEDHSSCLHISFFLVGEDDLAFDHCRYARLEPHWERDSQTWFNPNFFLFD